jgi:hypothetical protein
MVRYILEQRVPLYDSQVKCGSAGNRRRKFRRKFHDESVPSRQTIHNLMNKLKTTGLIIDKKQKNKRRVITEEKLNDIGARLEHTPRESQKRLAQESGVSKSNAGTGTQLLKLELYKATVIHTLLACDPASRVHFCSSFLQSVVVEGETDQQSIFFPDERWSHLQGHKNTQSICYWIS